MKTIIITGGLGYVGTELIKFYPRNKYKIIVIDKIENKKKIFFLGFGLCLRVTMPSDTPLFGNCRSLLPVH